MKKTKGKENSLLSQRQSELPQSDLPPARINKKDKGGKEKGKIITK